MTSRSECERFEQEMHPYQSTGAIAVSQNADFHKTEAELERTLALMQATIESAEIGIFAMGNDAKACYFNRRFAAMWQLPESVEISRDCSRARAFFENQVKNPEVFRRAIWEASTQSETDSFDALEMKDGRLFIHRASPQWLGNRVIGRVWSVWDNARYKRTTEESPEQKETEELQLRESKPKELKQDELEQEELEKAERIYDLKVQFVAATCHRFRSLLNIISFSNSLLNRNLGHWTADQNQPYLNHIQHAVDQIAQLLDEIALFSELTVGKIKLQPESLDFVSFCRNLITEMQPLSDGVQHTIEFRCQEESLRCSLDPKLFQAVLTKLLTNAIKYSPGGGPIYFNLTHCEQTVMIQIEDSGIGMPESDQERLFEPFFRGSNVGDVPGTGLGLATAKNLVDLHGGEMDWVSQVGVGTVVTIRFATS